MWQRLPRRSLAGASLAAAAPGLGVAVLAAGLAGLGAGWTAAFAGASVAGPAVVLAYLARRFERGVAALSTDLTPGEPVQPRGPIETALVATGRRLAGRYEAARQREARERARSDGLIEALPEPLVTVDDQRRLVRANAAARALLASARPGEDLTRGLRAPAVLDSVAGVLGGGPATSVEFSLPQPAAATYQARISPISGPEGATGAVIVLADVTALKRAEQMRADFVANASHELRTPLSSMLGFIETLRGPAADDPEAQQQFLARMEQQARRMSRLVHDLLSLSHIELSERTAPQATVDLRALLADSAERLAPTAEEAGMALVFNDHTSGPGLVKGDSDQLEQVVTNLVENAVKYGRAATEITVALREQQLSNGEAGLALAVTDRGEGIPRTHIPRLTERFYRGDVARSRQRGGTGLGLAIVKHIASRHRAELTIDSEPGQGSTFTVTVPAVTEL